MDDRFVKDISEDDVVSSAAYLLLYRRSIKSMKLQILPSYSDPEEVD